MSNYNDIKYEFPASSISSGTFADARIASSNVSQHASSFDDNNIVNDISTLALREASNEDRGFYHSNSQSIDVFQDNLGIDTTSNAIRNIAEYVSSEGISASFIPFDFANMTTPTVTTGNTSGYFNSTRMDPVYGVANNVYPVYIINNATGLTTSFATYDFGGPTEFGTQVTLGRMDNNGSVTQFRMMHSLDNSTFSAVNLNGASSLGISIASGGTSGGAFTSADSSGNINFNALPDFAKVHTETISLPNSFTARYIRTSVMSISATGGYPAYGHFKIHGKFPSGLQSSGNFTSTNVTAPSSTSSMGAIITYQDQSGTNALNTDIVLQLSADGGSNYSTATLTALPDFSTGIKMAKVNDLSVTAGTSLKYKISFANQSSGSKEARIRGVSLQY